MFDDDEEDHHENLFHKDVTLVMDPAKEPLDICWYNMGGVSWTVLLEEILPATCVLHCSSLL